MQAAGSALPSPFQAPQMLHSLSKGETLQSHHLPGQSVGVGRKPGFYAGCVLPGICEKESAVEEFQMALKWHMLGLKGQRYPQGYTTFQHLYACR